MKKNFILKSALCLTLAASILTMGACKSTGDNGDTTSASGDEQAAPVYYTDVPGSVKKSETVYVNMDNSGDVKDITVTDWLHTDKGQVKVSDTSSLKNITNVEPVVTIKSAMKEADVAQLEALADALMA